MATKTVDNGELTDYPVATNAGAVDDDTQRVTLASDDPAVVALQALDNAISGNEMQVDVLTMPTVTVTGTVTANAGTGPFPVSDNAGSLTVDAPVGTPVFVRLSDGSTAISTLPVSLASVPSHAVTNAGTFAVQVDGAALTALQLLDNIVSGSEAQVDIVSMPNVTIASGSVTASGTITAELSATDNAVLDTIDAVLDTIKTDTTAISTAVGPVTPGTRVSLIDVDETEDEIKATAGTLYSLVVTNLATSTRFVRMYNATAASTTVGTTTPWRGPYAIPAGAGMVYVFERGLTFGTALCIAATTGVADSDTGAPGANEVIAEVVYV